MNVNYHGLIYYAYAYVVEHVDKKTDDPRQRNPMITTTNELLGWEQAIKLKAYMSL